MLSISIISHGQRDLVDELLSDISKYCDDITFEVILTLNIPERQFDKNEYGFLIKIINNSIPKGFAENHNEAFKEAEGDYFCVLNPDVRLFDNPFSGLVHKLDGNIGVVSPLVVNSTGRIEDSMRDFPTVGEIFRKFFWGRSSVHHYNPSPDLKTIHPDWVAGMFMLFKSDLFASVGGFDRGYFLYYEDVDICARLRLEGYLVAVCADTRVIHDAQRSSHRKFSYLYWHVSSMFRFFCSDTYRKLRKVIQNV